MDSLNRLKYIKRLIGSKRKIVASDSTISRVVCTIDPQVIRKYLVWGYKKLKQEG
jgi:hypothetical protein